MDILSTRHKFPTGKCRFCGIEWCMIQMNRNGMLTAEEIKQTLLCFLAIWILTIAMRISIFLLDLTAIERDCRKCKSIYRWPSVSYVSITSKTHYHWDFSECCVWFKLPLEFSEPITIFVHKPDFKFIKRLLNANSLVYYSNARILNGEKKTNHAFWRVQHDVANFSHNKHEH